MNFIDFTAGINDNDRRIDKVIRVLLPEISLTEIFKAFRKGLIKINNKKAKQETRLKTGDIISIPEFMVNSKKEISSSEKNFSLLEKMPPVVFQNSHIIIYNKPSDLLVQGTKESLDKITELYYKKNFYDNSLAFTPGPLHRIDKNTTGLIAFSLSIEGARWFSENIKNHSIKKTYLAILQGVIKGPQHWEDHIKKTDESSKSSFHTVKIDNSEEANSITEITPLSSANIFGIPVTLAEVCIKTGKMHQIRSQSSYHGHPLLGDTAYGGENLLKHNINHKFFLHAWKLNIPENPLGLPEEIKAPLPVEFENFLLKTCRINHCEL